ncbi:hypothetical protein VB773_12005 [Haloarculaceae archaeon H-GB2-1]|nr:hypothetical protein [Haloarculaceae archaeon H-GB11]MEA5408209.1 hypothetical protein [Haloarculaceae archaeon H-GB2-1]
MAQERERESLTKDAYLDFGVYQEGGVVYLYVRNASTGDLDLFTAPVDELAELEREGVALSARSDVGSEALNYPDVVALGPDRYRLYVVDETTGDLRYATASSPEGPWTLQSSVAFTGSPDDVQILYEPTTERPFKLFYNDDAPRLAVSKDGREFEPAPESPLLDHGFDGSRIKDQDLVRADGRYVMYYVNGYNGTLGMAVSEDLSNWTDHGAPVVRHPLAYEEAQIHTPRFLGAPVNGTWYLFYGAADERTWYERQIEDENVHESVAYATSESLYAPTENASFANGVSNNDC